MWSLITSIAARASISASGRGYGARKHQQGIARDDDRDRRAFVDAM
jgi:hypothetical protein